MRSAFITLALLSTVVLAGCAGQSREARCLARGHAADSAELRACIDALAAQDRINRNRLQKRGQASGG